MNDEQNDSIFNGPGGMLIVIGLILLVLIVMNSTKPIQQAAPYYNGNSWHTEITIEDNDTNVCIGFCPDNR